MGQASSAGGTQSLDLYADDQSVTQPEEWLEYLEKQGNSARLICNKQMALCDAVAISALAYEVGLERSDPALLMLLVEALSNYEPHRPVYISKSPGRSLTPVHALMFGVGGSLHALAMVGLADYKVLCMYGNLRPLLEMSKYSEINFFKKQGDVKFRSHEGESKTVDFKEILTSLIRHGEVEAAEAFLAFHQTIRPEVAVSSLVTAVYDGFSSCPWYYGKDISYWMKTSSAWTSLGKIPPMDSPDRESEASNKGNYAYFSQLVHSGSHGRLEIPLQYGLTALDNLVYFGAKNGVIHCLKFAKHHNYKNWSRSGSALKLTVAHYAAQGMHWECVDFLGDQGVDLTETRDRNGFSAADLILKGLANAGDYHNFKYCAEKWKFQEWDKDFTPNHDSLAHLAAKFGCELLNRYLMDPSRGGIHSFNTRMNEDRITPLQLLMRRASDASIFSVEKSQRLNHSTPAQMCGDSQWCRALVSEVKEKLCEDDAVVETTS